MIGAGDSDMDLPGYDPPPTGVELDELIRHLNYSNFLEDSTTLIECNKAFDRLKCITSELDNRQLRLLNEKSSKSCSNLLMVASKCGHVKAVEFLIHCKLNVNLKNNYECTASDYAFDDGHFEILVKLLAADAPFPKNFKNFPPIMKAEHREKISKIATDTNEFHHFISIGELALVRKCVNDKPTIKIAYNSENQCALTGALKSKKLDIYAFLRENFFKPGIDSAEYFREIEKLGTEEKVDMNEKLREHFLKPVDVHISKLLFKSRVRSLGDTDQEKLLGFYTELYKIQELQSILKIVASSDATDIVYDFDQNHVLDIDHTANCTTLGRTYHTGYIQIGAGDAEPEVLSTIAHEFTHWALQLTYKNSCRPYSKNDLIRKKQFKKIIAFYKIQLQRICPTDICPAIASVFTAYKPYQYSQELIVTVSDMLAKYKSDTGKIKKYRKIFKRLFVFYKKKVQPDFDKYVRLLRPKKQIRDANLEFGMLVKLQHSNLLSSSYSRSVDINEKVFIASSVPELALESLVKQLRCDNEFSSENVFVELEDMKINHFFEKLKYFAALDVKPTFIIKDSKNVQFLGIRSGPVLDTRKTVWSGSEDLVSWNRGPLHFEDRARTKTGPEFGNFFRTDLKDQSGPLGAESIPDQWSGTKNLVKSEGIVNELDQFFCDNKIVFISNRNDNTFLKYFELQIKNNFSWNDLNEEEKSRILESTVVFQNFEVALGEILTDELFRLETPLEWIFNPSAMKLKYFNDTLPLREQENLPVYIKRTYEYPFENASRDESEQLESDEFEVLFEMLRKQKTVLIADLAGMGKTTAAVEMTSALKLKHKLCWVVFIDLKQRTKAFLRDDQQQTGSIDSDFFSRAVLKLEKNSFEQKLFENFYENRKVIFIFDGFDEVSPNYEKFVIKTLKSVKYSGNQLLVTTRPHYTVELEKELETKAIKLMPFTKKDQIEFLTQYWQDKSSGSDAESSLDLKSDIEEFLGNLAYDFCSVPIHIFMLAEVYGDQDIAEGFELNIFSLYKLFIEKKIDIWIEKGPLAKKDNTAIQMGSLNLRKIFQKLACEQIFDVDEVSTLGFPETTEDIFDEMIARVGIVAYGSKDTKEFSHRTYAEYFVADFIYNELTRKTPLNSAVNLFVKVMTRPYLEQISDFLADRLQISQVRSEPELLEYNEDVAEAKRIYLVFYALRTFGFDLNEKIELVKRFLLRAIGCRNIKLFRAVWNSVENFVDSNNIEKVQADLLFATNGDAGILSFAIKMYSVGSDSVLEFLLEKANNLLCEKDFLKFYYDEESCEFPFNVAFKNTFLFNMMWNVAIEKLGVENQKKLLIGTNREGKTCLHRFCEQQFLVDPDYFLSKVKDLLSVDELEKLLTAKDKHEKLFTYYFVQNRGLKLDVFYNIWNFVKENANEATMKLLIFPENQNDSILVQASFSPFAACRMSKAKFMFASKRITMVNYIFELEGTETIDFLRDQDYPNNVSLIIAVYSIRNVEKLQESFGKTGLRNILLSNTTMDGEEKNVFQLLIISLCKVREQGTAMELWKKIVDIIADPEEIKKQLLDSGRHERNCLSDAASRGSPVLMEMLKWWKENYKESYKEELKKILSEPDEDGLTVLHHLNAAYNVGLIHSCLNFISINFEQEDQQKMFLLKNNDGEIPLQGIFFSKSFEAFWQAYCQVFSTNELDDIISKENFIARSQNNYDDIQKLIGEWRASKRYQCIML